MAEEEKIPEQVAPEPAKFEWAKTKQDTPEIYGNYFHVSWTLFDVRFQLGQLIPKDTNIQSSFFAEHRGAVTIAWPEAKLLRDTLIDLVARYEKANGEIKPIKLPANTP
jgi:hypothetical protein